MSEKLPFRPDIQYNIAVYRFPHDSSLKSVHELTSRIHGHISILRGLHVSGILISFKDIPTLEQSSLSALIKGLFDLHLKYEVPLGLGEYPHHFFPVLLKFVEQTPISLFKSIEIMALAIGTSHLSIYSSILVYMEDMDEAQAIASHLIARQFFVVIAESKEDMREKISNQKKPFDRIVTESHFAIAQEQVIINFEKGIFVYNFQGSLNASLDKNITLRDLIERLEFGYRVFLFKLDNVFHIDMYAAYTFSSILKVIQQHGGVLCLTGFTQNKLESNALTIMEKGDFWSYPNMEDIFADKEIIEILKKQRLNLNSQGISKRIISLMPFFIKATKKTLKRLGITECSSASEQGLAGQKEAIEAYISTHTDFTGDYVGEMNFIFPKESIDVILGSKSSDELLGDEDEMDALKEFSRTIMAKLKTDLAKKRQAIDYTFPTATNDHKEQKEVIEYKYILETFRCNGHPFYVTITDYIPEEQALSTEASDQE